MNERQNGKCVEKNRMIESQHDACGRVQISVTVSVWSIVRCTSLNTHLQASTLLDIPLCECECVRIINETVNLFEWF